MKITFLGTGTSQGVPVIGCDCRVCTSTDPKDNRLRCSILIEIEDVHIVIDTGPDFRTQMLRSNNKQLDAVLITHEHNDHMIGLDDIRPYAFYQKTYIDVYAMPRVATEIRNKFAYAFHNPYPGAPRINLIEIKDNTPFLIKKIKMTPIPIVHRELDILGYRIGDFVYITDASFVSESSHLLLKNVDTLVINALRKKKHPSHFNLEEALSFINKVKPKRAYLTHISHDYKPQAEWANELTDNVHVAWDGLVLTCL